MESEKVKEIKECLEEFKDDRIGYYTNGIDRFMLRKEDALTLINELESENAYKQEHIELWFNKNEEKKKRIAELEKENEKLLDSVETVQNDRCVFKCELTKKQLKQFAERLKEKLDSVDLIRGWTVKVFIDETLKEFVKN